MTTTTILQEKIDIALVKGSDGIHDYEIDGNGDFLGDAGFDSSIIQDVHSELRATEDEEKVALKRRGSIVNETPVVSGWTVGSKLWFYDQARATIKTKNSSADTLRDSLSKYVPNLLQGVKVVGVLTVNGVRLNVTLTRLNGKTEDLYFNLWENTGN